MRLAVHTSAKSRRRSSANTALRGLRGLLAARAVIALAKLVRVEADVDRRPALEARQAPSLLHRAKLSTIESEARSPWAAIAIAAQELARGEDHPAKLGVVDIGDLRPGPCAGDEQRLVLDLVPDSRKGALVEEGGGDIALRLRAQPANALVEIEVIGDHIRPELGYHGMERHLTGGHELDDRGRLAGSDVLVGADHD